MESPIQIERQGAVEILSINRPKALNALNLDTLSHLAKAIAGAKEDGDVRAVIITGSGTKAFVAGADIAELATLEPASAREYARYGQLVFDQIEALGKPVIAAVNGFALGGGCELAMACTLRIAAENATFGQPEINLGLIPGFGGTQRLPRLIGGGRALELLLGGHQISASEAYRVGLVNRVVPSSELMAEATAWAIALTAKAALAARYVIAAVNAGRGTTLEGGQLQEASLFGLIVSTDDMREGTRAFMDKRKPVFTGK
jgi:enoyl-CoA hydratase/carnithine racemase